MKVYVVSYGAWEDWTIAGIFSSVQAAEDFMENNPAPHPHGWNEVGVYELDKGAI